MIYRHSMDNPSKRSASVTAAAVVAILTSLLILLGCSMALFSLLLFKLPANNPEIPSSVKTAMVVMQGFMIALSLFGIATGIGLLYLRKWARISILIWGGFFAFFGVLGIPVVYLMRFPPTTNSDRKSTRLNSSHVEISYAVFCLKKKTKNSYGLPTVIR